MITTKAQLTALNDDGSATMASWEVTEEDARMLRALLTRDLGPPGTRAPCLLRHRSLGRVN
jgi:hypothetical protein